VPATTLRPALTIAAAVSSAARVSAGWALPSSSNAYRPFDVAASRMNATVAMLAVLATNEPAFIVAPLPIRMPFGFTRYLAVGAQGTFKLRKLRARDPIEMAACTSGCAKVNDSGGRGPERAPVEHRAPGGLGGRGSQRVIRRPTLAADIQQPFKIRDVGSTLAHTWRDLEKRSWGTSR
jgi:hypothetical protein